MYIYKCHFNVLKIIVHRTKVFLSIFQTTHLSRSNIFHQIRHVLKSDYTSDIRQNVVSSFLVLQLKCEVKFV